MQSILALALVLIGGGAAAPVAAQAGPTHPYYPTGIGDRWTYESTLRGRFTNQVVDTVRFDGRLYVRVESVQEGGSSGHFHMRVDGDRVYRRTEDGTEVLFVDFGVAVGGSYKVRSGTSETTVTMVAEHDTLSVLGTPHRAVRVFRTSGAGAEYDTFFARGFGIVGTQLLPGGAQSRLVEADVGGARFMAAAVMAPRTGIAARVLSDSEVEALALLAKVWGFVKYHHPAVTGGGVDWDAELFSVATRVVEAGTPRAASSVMERWLAGLGDPPACRVCARLPEDPHLEPDLAWMADTLQLGATLSARLGRIYENRSTTARQRYVHHQPGIGNPIFSGEDAYPDVEWPDAGHRLLGLFRFWNIVRYWFPYRDLIDDDWGAVLREFIPRVMENDDRDAYLLAMLELAGRTADTHAGVSRAYALRPPRGAAELPVVIRFVEGRAVVWGYSHDAMGPASGLLRGDVITHLGGASVDSLVNAWTPWYPASNDPARLRAIARAMTRGEPGPVRVSGRRGGAPLEREVERVPIHRLNFRAGLTHDLPGETFQWLSDDVAYLKLSGIRAADVPGHLREAGRAAVLVVDIRNYPNEFVPFALGGRLVREPTPFARFTIGDPSNPGAFVWTPPLQLSPLPDRFEGAVVVLVDESSISQSEYTAMALRAGPNTIVVGSTTSAADGNISSVPLPGGVEAIITGIGVFYPDRTPTQRVGIVPDLYVRPTVQGIREGRDEVLEAGVSRALGREFRLRR